MKSTKKKKKRAKGRDRKSRGGEEAGKCTLEQRDGAASSLQPRGPQPLRSSNLGPRPHPDGDDNNESTIYLLTSLFFKELGSQRRFWEENKEENKESGFPHLRQNPRSRR